MVWRTPQDFLPLSYSCKNTHLSSFWITARNTNQIKGSFSWWYLEEIFFLSVIYFSFCLLLFFSLICLFLSFTFSFLIPFISSSLFLETWFLMRGEILLKLITCSQDSSRKCIHLLHEYFFDEYWTICITVAYKAFKI